VSFALAASEAGSTFLCALDGRSFAPCSSPLTIRRVRAGRHTVEVYATDAVGNADPTSAVKNYKVKKKRKRRGHR
jgi:hypothetical protein